VEYSTEGYIYGRKTTHGNPEGYDDSNKASTAPYKAADASPPPLHPPAAAATRIMMVYKRNQLVIRTWQLSLIFKPPVPHL